MMLKGKKFLTRFSLLLLAAGLLITATACDTNPTEDSSENFADSSMSESSELDTSPESNESNEETGWHQKTFYWTKWEKDGYLFEIRFNIPKNWKKDDLNTSIDQYFEDENRAKQCGSLGLIRILEDGETFDDLVNRMGENSIQDYPGKSLLGEREYIVVDDREYLLEKLVKTGNADKGQPGYQVEYNYYFEQDGMVGNIYFPNWGDDPENIPLYEEILANLEIFVTANDHDESLNNKNPNVEDGFTRETFLWKKWEDNGYIITMNLDVPDEWEKYAARRVYKYFFDENGEIVCGSAGSIQFLENSSTPIETVRDFVPTDVYRGADYEYPDAYLISSEYVTVGKREYLLNKSIIPGEGKKGNDATLYEYFYIHDGIVGDVYFIDRDGNPENLALYEKILNSMSVTVEAKRRKETMYWTEWEEDGRLIKMTLFVPQEWDKNDADAIDKYFYDENHHKVFGCLGVTHVLEEDEALELLIYQAGDTPLMESEGKVFLGTRDRTNYGGREIFIEKSILPKSYIYYKDNVELFEFYFEQDGLVYGFYYINRGDESIETICFRIFSTVKITVTKTYAE